MTFDPALKRPAVWNKEPVAGVKRIIAVASGKGGVGKSTTAVNLARAFALSGKKAGVLDADIYGPSIPSMMGLGARPEIDSGGKMVPLEAQGIQCMSVGFIIDSAAILRGPMIGKTITQLLRGTRWHDLDVLVVDMPPGTGDVHLSLCQQAPIDGAVIVTTPQEVALIDARKCITMFTKVNVPVLGVIENMSGDLFGHGGGKKLAGEAGVAFLGDIAADAAIRETGDAGKTYSGSQAAQYVAIASALKI